ncbi:MAG: hypothetical protein EBX37_06765, partial [Alphaproteobacteria bacterium]|nr:hypothetical protein [Alphaproteobacteria bacterium]
SSALSAANVEQRRPDIGLTTVEPAAFLGRSSGTVKNPDNSTYASYTVLRRDISALTGVVPTADLVNGLVVTKALRDALQRAQGLTVGSELEADVPSLTNAQINALFTQSIVDWSNLLVGATGTPLTSVAGVTAPASTKVFVVRRDNGSGNQIGTEGFFTQGQFNWAAATTGDTDTGLTTVPAGPFVFSGTNTRANQDTFRTLNTNNVWAIGLLSTEKPNLNSTTSGTSRENGYRFIAVNGATPSLVNVVKGRYPIYNTTSVVYNTAFLKTRPLGVQYLAAAVTRGLSTGLRHAGRCRWQAGLRRRRHDIGPIGAVIDIEHQQDADGDGDGRQQTLLVHVVRYNRVAGRFSGSGRAARGRTPLYATGCSAICARPQALFRE